MTLQAGLLHSMQLSLDLSEIQKKKKSMFADVLPYTRLYFSAQVSSLTWLYKGSTSPQTRTRLELLKLCSVCKIHTNSIPTPSQQETCQVMTRSQSVFLSGCIEIYFFTTRFIFLMAVFPSDFQESSTRVPWQWRTVMSWRKSLTPRQTTTTPSCGWSRPWSSLTRERSLLWTKWQCWTTSATPSTSRAR